MPDEQRKTPIPAVMNVAEFMERFGSQEACVEHLRTVRWRCQLRFGRSNPTGWNANRAWNTTPLHEGMALSLDSGGLGAAVESGGRLPRSGRGSKMSEGSHCCAYTGSRSGLTDHAPLVLRCPAPPC